MDEGNKKVGSVEGQGTGNGRMSYSPGWRGGGGNGPQVFPWTLPSHQDGRQRKSSQWNLTKTKNRKTGPEKDGRSTGKNCLICNMSR